MKNSLIKKILLFAAVFCAGFLLVPFAGATESPLKVEYWSDSSSSWLPLSDPIFNEANFMPGEDVLRRVRVTNYSQEEKRIAAETINETDPDNFASQLNLVISEEGKAGNIFDDTLAQFFSQGETYLSSVAGSGGVVIYDFTIAFDSSSGNDWQEKILGFDMIVGFEGTEGGQTLPGPGEGTGSSGGGGGGGALPSGLTIFNEASWQVTDTSATINWVTTYDSTSQVIYAAAGEPYGFDLSQPNYGYPHATIENLTKVVGHSVVINGLTAGTTYYYRCVSHGSLAVSAEHSFATLEASGGSGTENILAQNTGGTENAGGIGGTGGSGALPTALPTDEQGGTGGIANNNGANGGQVQQTGGQASPTASQSGGQGGTLNNLLANISGFLTSKNFGFLLLLIIIILIVLYFISKRKKKKQNQQTPVQ